MAVCKQGLDYYSVYTGKHSDRRLRYIRRDFGSAGADVWYALLDVIYSGEGYYLDFSEAKRCDVLWDIRDIVSSKDTPDADDIARMIEAYVRLGMLDESLYEKGVLTSQAIQEQYYQSTLKRKAVKIEPDYWLLTVGRMTSLAAKSPILAMFVEPEKHYDGIMDQNDVKMPQSKVNKKEIKEKEIKEESKAGISSAEAEEPSGAEATEPTDTETSDIPDTLPADKCSLSDEEIHTGLVAQYGSSIVKQYEQKFLKWAQKRGAEKVSMYRQIQKWLIMDIGNVPQRSKHFLDGGTPSSFDTDEIMKSVMQKYTNT